MDSSHHLGDCKLCHAAGVPLMDSHILSKWTYRRASDPKRTNGSQSPVKVGRGVVVQTSEEIKEHLLCFDCEQRLGRDEAYVSRLAYQPDGTLGLFGQLPAGALIEVSADRFLGGTIKAASLASFDRLKLGRFAASIFWRAHVSSRYEFKALRLWSPQAEALRRYVLGEAPLPRGMCVTMFVLAPGDEVENVHNTTTISPTSDKTGEDGKHLFAVAGLLFNLSTGSESAHRLCLDGPSPHALIRSWRDYGIFRQVSDLVRSSTPKGRLAR